MPCGNGPTFATGVQRLVDSAQRYRRGSLGFCLRLRNFPDLQNQPWSQLGFQIAPTGSTQTGTADVPIKPPPTVTMVPMKNIAASNGKLRYGARKLTISHSFVLAQMKAQSLTDPMNVWNGAAVVGLVSENKLFSIEDIEHIEISGVTVQWFLTVNVNELR